MPPMSENQNLKLSPEQLEEQQVAEERREQEMMQQALFGSGVIRLEAEVPTLDGGEPIKVSLNIRWPDFEDEELMTTRTSIFLRGLAPEQVSMADANFARARAMIEQLAVGPFPTWMTRFGAITKDKVAHRENQEIRPDTSKLRNRPLVVALYQKYVSYYNRFHRLSLQ